MIYKNIIARSNLLLALLTFLFLTPAPLYAIAASATVSVWWPTNGAHVLNVQPLKAMVSGLDVSQYEMFWQVDGGQWNWMDNNYNGAQHKEASADVSSWTWHGSGPYAINFIARQNGAIIAQQQEAIYVDNGSQPVTTTVTLQPVAPQTTTQQQTTATVAAPSTPTAKVTISAPVVTVNTTGLYTKPNSSAAQQATTWASSNPTGAAAMQVLASQPTAQWFGDWNANVQSDVHTLVTNAQSSNTMPVMVVYNIPQRDCGGFSAGGTNNPAGYTTWINAFAAGLGTAKAMVILEPDALAQISCLSAADQTTRLQLLSAAVSAIKKDANAKVYVDAGHSGWIDPTTMAHALTSANISQADGFALNVSNFMATSNEVSYGQQVSAQLNNKHFVVDTSRNGNGSNGQWCNPSGMAMGQKPTLQTGNALADGYLWIKTPGESDGACSGGPSAGVWWPEYALQLVQNAHN